MIRIFMQVYRPHALMICSYSKGGAAMSFVPAFDPNRKAGRVEKGTRVYNYDQQVYFTLNIEEALLLAKLFEALLERAEFSEVELRTGSFYITKDDYGVHINVKHFDPQTNKPSTFVVTRTKNGQYKVGIIDSTSGQNIFLNLDVLEATAFVKYLEHTATFFSTQIALTKFEAYKHQDRQNRSNQTNNGGNQQYTKSYKSQPQQSNQQNMNQQTPPPPPQQNIYQPQTSQSNSSQANMFLPPPPSDE